MEPKYRREFLKSPHHAWLGLLTLGAGFITAQPLFLLAGAAAYALGWVYLPDVGWFRNWVDAKQGKLREAASRQELEAFLAKRQQLLNQLSDSRRARYLTLADVCGEIERVNADDGAAVNEPARFRKLDELMWTYLRLLGIEESLERFLETERREQIPALVQEAEEETRQLSDEVERMKGKTETPIFEAKQRRLHSCQERLSVLQKRLRRIEQAQANLDVVISEQDRLTQEIKLIRADAIASRNAQALSARIDGAVEHLHQTNQWLAEMDQFKDLIQDMPAVDARIGYRPVPPPLLATQTQKETSAKRDARRSSAR